MKTILLSLLLPFYASLCSLHAQVIIHEFMADPSPARELPAYEWIELKNTGSQTIQLAGWRIHDAGSSSGAFPAIELEPESFLIVCGNTASISMQQYGNVVSVTGFPSLDNNGDILYLTDAAGNIVHALNYHSGWYGNAVKENGGWTLEMVDPLNACGRSENWKASMDNSGGTPGRINSVAGHNPDTGSPQLLRSYAIDSVTIVVLFDEQINHSALTTSNFQIQGFTIVDVSTIAPLFNEVVLKLSTPLEQGTTYLLQANEITDCASNLLTAASIKSGWALTPQPGDIIINEILFNPRAGGSDFVELVNRGSKVVDAASLFIANRDADGLPAAPVALSSSTRLIFPGEYLAVSRDLSIQFVHYSIQDPAAMAEIPSFPSMPDDEGTVLLIDAHENIIDEVSYSEKWHFPLLDNNEGVSLERISVDGASNESGNWHSASSTAGWATPGYRNSQFIEQAMGGIISATPQVISPDNDGRDDLLLINYQFSEPGNVINITIYDIRGRPVAFPARNMLTGGSGTISWKGFDGNGNRLPTGNYIIFTEIYNLQGKVRKHKMAVAIAPTWK